MVLRPNYDESDRTTVEHVPWPEFIRDVFSHEPGEHITIIGPTGLGKTTLALNLIDHSGRAHRDQNVVVFASKRKDPKLSALRHAGFQQVDHWPKSAFWQALTNSGNKGRRRLLWPRLGTRADVADVSHASAVFKRALNEIMAEGNWTVYIDELLFAAHSQWLNLRRELELYWQQARTESVSLIVSTQRSANVPLLAYNQVSHLFVFRENDRRNAERIGEMAGQDRKLVQELVSGLPRHTFLYLSTRDDIMVTSRAPKGRATR